MRKTESLLIPESGHVQARLRSKLGLSRLDAVKQLLHALSAFDKQVRESARPSLDAREVLAHFQLFTRTWELYLKFNYPGINNNELQSDRITLPTTSIERYTDTNVITALQGKYGKLGAQELEREAMAFLAEAASRSLGGVPAPSGEVDDAWHQMILRPLTYQLLCIRYFGQFIGHVPYGEPKHIGFKRIECFDHDDQNWHPDMDEREDMDGEPVSSCEPDFGTPKVNCHTPTADKTS